MSAEDYLESLAREGRQLEKLLRLQAHLRDQHRALKDEQPALAQKLLGEAQALEQEILRQYRGMDALASRLRRYIDRLPDPREREVLGLMYLRRIPVEEVARILHYTPRHCYRLRRRALEHLEALRL